jgi:hypothetical protein
VEEAKQVEQARLFLGDLYWTLKMVGAIACAMAAFAGVVLAIYAVVVYPLIVATFIAVTIFFGVTIILPLVLLALILFDE